MPKHIDTLGKFADYKAPWESETGEVEIDKDKLKKLTYDLRADKAKALDAKDEAAEKLAAAETERDEFKSQVDSKDPDAAGKIAKAEQKAKDAEAKAAAAELRADRAEVAAEKGLTPAQAKRLQGSTKEELEADADEFIKDLAPARPEGEEDPEEDEATGRVVPRNLSLNNGGDPQVSADAEPDYDKLVAGILPSRTI